jgi:predicted transcriptional regulator of viral defense system
MATPTRRALMAIMGRNKLVRSRDLRESRVDRSELRRLTAAGVLERVTRGVYRLVDAPATEAHTVATVIKRVPQGTVCLLTALQLHGLTTQLPHQVWIALDRKARRPRLTDLPVRVMRFSGAALTAGVETRKVEGVAVRVYGTRSGSTSRSRPCAITGGGTQSEARSCGNTPECAGCSA